MLGLSCSTRGLLEVFLGLRQGTLGSLDLYFICLFFCLILPQEYEFHEVRKLICFVLYCVPNPWNIDKHIDIVQ